MQFFHFILCFCAVPVTAWSSVHRVDNYSMIYQGKQSFTNPPVPYDQLPPSGPYTSVLIEPRHASIDTLYIPLIQGGEIGFKNADFALGANVRMFIEDAPGTGVIRSRHVNTGQPRFSVAEFEAKVEDMPLFVRLEITAPNGDVIEFMMNLTLNAS